MNSCFRGSHYAQPGACNLALHRPTNCAKSSRVQTLFLRGESHGKESTELHCSLSVMQSVYCKTKLFWRAESGYLRPADQVGSRINQSMNQSINRTMEQASNELSNQSINRSTTDMCYFFQFSGFFRSSRTHVLCLECYSVHFVYLSFLGVTQVRKSRQHRQSQVQHRSTTDRSASPTGSSSASWLATAIMV